MGGEKKKPILFCYLESLCPRQTGAQRFVEVIEAMGFGAAP